MKKNYVLTCLLLLTGVQLVYTQSILRPNNWEASQTNEIQLGGNDEIETAWNEDIEARTVHTSTYYSEDGQIKIVNSQVPINYYNSSNQLLPIDYQLKREGPCWAAMQQAFPTYLNEDGSFALTMDNGQKITLGVQCTLNGTPLSSKFKFTGNSVLLENIVPGIDKQLEFRENSVKYNYVLREPALGMQQCVFSEEIDLPPGYRLVRDELSGEENENGWSGNLLVLNPAGEYVSTFQIPICFDALQNQVFASYNILKAGEKYLLEINVPMSWINSASRVYPIVIDPLVTGPTSNWAGSPLASCLSPTYGKDSLLVTIPAGVTVTQLNVTAGFYAVSPAITENGIIKFSTSCGATGTFTVPAGQGQTQGSANLASTNIYNPLTCCFPESCNDTSFYLYYNLSRNAPGSGCNTTYVYYSTVPPLFFSAANPFTAVIVGKTAETYGGQWSVSPVSKCSNDCSINGIAYVYYGVPPYTFTHPWSPDIIIDGDNVGCSNGATTHNFSLTIPNCPSYCDPNYTSLDVPPAIIIDACGNAVSGLPTKVVPIITAPDISANFSPEICSGQPFTIDLTSCVATANLSWSGNGESGTTDITDTLINTTNSATTFNYSASAESNGCYSDTIEFSIDILPLPIPEFTSNPNPIVSGISSEFTDQTVFPVSPGNFWSWNLGDGTYMLIENPIHTYNNPGEYEVCLFVEDLKGCQDSICKLIPVVPAEVNRPNIVTPNNDGINDLLIFNYLEFYPNNELYIFNRWGNIVYQTSGYTNNWNGAGNSEGTYYYLLKIIDTDQTYDGFFQLVY